MTPFEVFSLTASSFALVFIGLIALWRPWKRTVDAAAPSWAFPPLLAAGYVTGHTLISSFPAFPAVTADEWLVYASIAAALWGLLEACFKKMPAPFLHSGRLILLGTFFWLMAGPRLGVVFFLGLTAVSLCWLTLLDRATAHRGNLTAVIILVLLSGLSGVIFVLGASLKLALLSWALCAGLSAKAMVVALTTAQRRAPLTPALPLIALLVVGLFISGVLYAQAPLASAVGIVAACAAPLCLNLWLNSPHRSGADPSDRWRRAKLGIGQFALALLIAGAATGYAFYDTQIAEDEVDDEVYDPYDY